MLSPEDVDLVASLRKIADLMPGIAFDLVVETLPPEREHEFGQILITLGEILSDRSERRGISDRTIEHEERSSLTKRLDDLTERPNATAAEKPGRK